MVRVPHYAHLWICCAASLASILRATSSDDHPLLPVFVKLNKVGSTTLSTFLECHAGTSGTRGAGSACRIADSRAKMDAMSGPWSHGPMIHYADTNSSADGLKRCFDRRMLLVTMLRDPVERFFSFARFYFTKHYTKNLDEKIVDLVSELLHYPDRATPATIDAAFSAVEGLFRNDRNWARVRQYEDVFARVVGEPLSLQRVQQLAEARLSQFDVVGLTERLEDTLALVALKMKWPSHALCLPVDRMRAHKGEGSSNTSRTYAGRYPAEVVAALTRRLAGETAVYEVAVRLHEVQQRALRSELDEMRASRDRGTAECAAKRQDRAGSLRPRPSNAAAIVEMCRAWRAPASSVDLESY